MDTKDIKQKQRVELNISNVSVTDTDASCIISLKAVPLDAFNITAIELTGLLFACMEATKNTFDTFNTRIPEPKIKKVTVNGKHYRKWTPEEIERAKETRRNTLLQQTLTKGNAEEKPADKKAKPVVPGSGTVNHKARGK